MSSETPVPAGRTVVAAIDPFDPNVIWLHSAGGTIQDLTTAEAMTLADELQEQAAIGRLRALDGAW